MIAFYNEIDDYCCAWLSNLMDAGHITSGVISNKSIEDLIPYELIGYDRVHLFAGIGVWDYALRLAGWPSDRPVWTLSCPCQPFSAAGKGVGFDDKRHLWPYAQWLIEQCRPVECIGEQVASKDADTWIDLVQADLEALGYAVGAVPFPSAGVGAPHIRDRLYWVANAGQLPEGRSARSGETESGRPFGDLARYGDARGMANASQGQRRWRPDNGALLGDGTARGRDESASDTERDCRARGMANAGLSEPSRWNGATQGLQHRNGDARGEFAPCSALGRLADTNGRNAGTERQQCGGEQRQQSEDGGAIEWLADASSERPLPGTYAGVHRGKESARARNGELERHGHSGGAGPTNGFWRDVDWLGCRDGKWRPVRPGSFPLVNGASQRVGRLRAYGNAINARQAQVFIEAYLEI